MLPTDNHHDANPPLASQCCRQGPSREACCHAAACCRPRAACCHPSEPQVPKHSSAMAGLLLPRYITGLKGGTACLLHSMTPALLREIQQSSRLPASCSVSLATADAPPAAQVRPEAAGPRLLPKSNLRQQDPPAAQVQPEIAGIARECQP